MCDQVAAETPTKTEKKENDVCGGDESDQLSDQEEEG
jgi:hypothetical protein